MRTIDLDTVIAVRVRVDGAWQVFEPNQVELMSTAMGDRAAPTTPPPTPTPHNQHTTAPPSKVAG